MQQCLPCSACGAVMTCPACTWVPGMAVLPDQTLLTGTSGTRASWWHGMAWLQVVVVLSGSMEPAFYRGDILFLNMGRAPFRCAMPAANKGVRHRCPGHATLQTRYGHQINEGWSLSHQKHLVGDVPFEGSGPHPLQGRGGGGVQHQWA